MRGAEFVIEGWAWWRLAIWGRPAGSHAGTGCGLNDLGLAWDRAVGDEGEVYIGIPLVTWHANCENFKTKGSTAAETPAKYCQEFRNHSKHKSEAAACSLKVFSLVVVCRLQGHRMLSLSSGTRYRTYLFSPARPCHMVRMHLSIHDLWWFVSCTFWTAHPRLVHWINLMVMMLNWIVN